MFFQVPFASRGGTATGSGEEDTTGEQVLQKTEQCYRHLCSIVAFLDSGVECALGTCMELQSVLLFGMP